MKPSGETLLALAFTLLAGWAVFEAREWPLSARLFPWLAGIPLFVLSALLLAVNLITPTVRGGKALDFEFSEDVEPGVARTRALNIIAWLFGFTAAIWILGFHIAIPCIVFLYLRVEGRETWNLSLSLTIVAYLFFWGFFDRLLNLPMPEAQLWNWMEILAG